MIINHDFLKNYYFMRLAEKIIEALPLARHKIINVDGFTIGYELDKDIFKIQVREGPFKYKVSEIIGDVQFMTYREQLEIGHCVIENFADYLTGGKNEINI